MFLRFTITLYLVVFYALPCVGDEQSRPYSLAVTDIQGLEELQREFQKFQALLTELTGYTFKLFPISGRTAVVESFRRKRLDFALAGPAEYVAIKSRAAVLPVVGLTRDNYSSVILTKNDSGIRSLEDLKGEKIGLGDFGSTSYHLAPLQIMADSGLDIRKDIKPVNLNKHIVWKSLLKGHLKAIGFSTARYQQFLDEDPELKKDNFTILAKGPELPNDLFMAGEHVPVPVVKALRDAFSDHGEELLDAMLTGKRNAKYAKMSFATNIADSDYNYIRKMYKTAGLEKFSG